MRKTFCVIALSCLWLAPLFAKEVAPAVSVQSVTVEKVKKETYFSIDLTWPAAEVPADHGTFARKQLPSSLRRQYFWPNRALQLIPQDPAVQLVFPAESTLSTSRAPAELRFLGRLSKKGSHRFLLRCPASGGNYRLLPLVVDFDKAARGKGLARAWILAQANFMGAQRDRGGRSFFAYAYEKLRARLGKNSPLATRRDAWQRPRRGGLYEVTTGALALQESLQLDRMTNSGRDTGKRSIPVKKLSGVTVRSHPWPEMIGKSEPKIEPIAGLVPADWYYLRFTTSKSLRNFLNFLDSWGGSLLAQVETGGQDFQTRQKIEEQICIRASWLSDLLGPAVIESLAITGSDPYMREGSDFSLLFRLKSPELFKAAVDRYIDEAKQKHADLKESKQRYRGVSIERYLTPDRTVSLHRARLADTYVYSNSPAAIRRIIDTEKGKVPSLKSSQDFVYMRSLYPLGDAKEDGFIFLSDAWLRYMTGPALRIGQKRRLETLTSMQIVKNAALFYLWEHPGAQTPALKTLARLGYLDCKQLWTVPGDRLSWTPEKFEAQSKKFGRFGYLTPHLENPVVKVSKQEQQEYETFRRRYQDYWRTYFDPVGIRVGAGQDISIELTILPLIDNSEYRQTRDAVGGKAVALEPKLRSGPVVFHLASHLNPEGREFRQAQSFAVNMLGNNRIAVEWIGERIEFWVEDSDALNEFLKDKKFNHFFQVPMVFGVQVKNKLGLAAFLVAMQSTIKTGAPGLVRFESIAPYQGAHFTAIRPTPGSPADDELKDAALYYGAVEDMLYVSTSLKALHHLVDQPTEPKDFGAAEKAHLSLRVNADAADQTRALAEQVLIDQARHAEQSHLRNLWLLAHTVGLGPKAQVSPKQVLGYRIDSVLGNQYHYQADSDQIVGSVSGSLWAPKTPTKLAKTSPLGRLLHVFRSLRSTLEFTPEGLHTELTIRRRKN